MVTAAFGPTPFHLDPAAPATIANKPYRNPGGMGPLLRFGGIKGTFWTGSVLKISPINAPAPSLNLYDNGSVRPVLGAFLDAYGGFNFFRFEIGVQLGQYPRQVEYEVTSEMGRRYAFHIPALNQDSRVCFFKDY
jgi:hypothetical protein